MSGRRLSDDEETLWSGVTRSIKPLRPPRPAGKAVSPAKSARNAGKDAPSPLPGTARERPPIKPPPLTPFNRRLKQRVARGREDIDARIDLHGKTQSEAHAALLRFLRHAQADGRRMALIVTGKGSAGAGAERGVLKRQVPRWLALPEFRPFVVAFDDAHLSHGGEGALYVRLRRVR
jgi:DNA-nicking Smr family endonuclease